MLTHPNLYPNSEVHTAHIIPSKLQTNLKAETETPNHPNTTSEASNTKCEKLHSLRKLSIRNEY